MTWKAKTFRCCAGKLMMGPCKFSMIYLYMIITYGLILSANGTFYENLKNTYAVVLNYLLCIVLFFTCVFYCMTAFRDPGILLRHQNYDHIELKKELAKVGSFQTKV